MASIIKEIFFPKKLEFLFKPSAYKVLYGGRSAVKTYSATQALVMLAATSHKRILCTRETLDSIKDSVHHELCDKIQWLGLEAEFHITERSITHKFTKSEFIFRGIRKHSVSNIKSIGHIDICLVEEAENTANESWDILLPTIRKENSEIWIIFNPAELSSATYQRWIVNPPPNCISVLLSYKDNKFLSEKTKADIEFLKKTNYEKYEHIYLGKPLEISDAIIFAGKYRVENFSEKLEKDAQRLFFGADFGFSQDPSTLIRCFIIDKTLYISHEAWGTGVEIDELPKLYRSVPGADEWPIKADSARPETISYLKRNGFNISAAAKWPKCVEDGIEHLRSFDCIVIHERCKNMAAEARLYAYKTDPKTNEVLPIVLDKNNHGWDAVRYSLDGYIRSKGPIRITAEHFKQLSG